MIASRITRLPKRASTTWIACRSSGGVWMIERSRMPASDMWSVRGIGVAVSVSTSTSFLNSLIRSLCFTPNLCSSSTTSRPRFLNTMSFWSSRCVPITMSTVPLFMPLSVSCCSDLRPEAGQHLHADREGREPLRRRCGSAGRPASVVGTSTAACMPSSTALNAARSATSVLP